MRACASLLLAASLATAPAEVSAQAAFPLEPRLAFVAIGPDTLTVRAWTAEWVRGTLRREAPRLYRQLWDYGTFLSTYLDTYEVDPQEPRPAGPNAELVVRSRYPHDLRVPLIWQDMRAVVEMGRIASFAQVIVELQRPGYRLTAIIIHRDDPTTAIHLTATDHGLQRAATSMARQLIWEWERHSRAR